MDKHHITESLDRVVAALEAKGFVEGHAELNFRDSGSYTQLRLEFDYKLKADGTRKYESVTQVEVMGELDGIHPTEFVNRALDKIAALPSKREQEVKDFVNQMESLRQRAEDLGIDEDFVNPLVAIMQKLASNALPAPKF